MNDKNRRRLLQAALGFGGSALAARVLGQAGRNLGITERAAPAAPGGGATAAALLGAKRRALVIGNSSYGFSPLKNPANDAKAISDALKATGFEVTTALDFNREQMVNAIRAYSRALARDKAVGLFYFAGHGVQLAWRNYLLPTDARVERLEQIQESCVDVNNLIDGIAKAANPMNVVILDACRENPFGGDFRVEQKGLSQLDAPPGTLLAYATSPGNVASDGAGDNGLYTENLLKELKVPEAKIEDVFKRVRLAVRRRSNGLQIPWESTSLEEDFWFIPPKELKKQAEAEREREFKRQQELWEKVQAAERKRELAEDFLRQYPTGFFAELAELELDRALEREGEQRIQVVSSPQNPYSQGSARADTKYKVGDSYTSNVLDYFTDRVNRTVTARITQITDREVIYNNGVGITDLLGNPAKNPNGVRFTTNQIAPLEFAVGRRWSTRYWVTNPDTSQYLVNLDLRIARKERITVPAGTFDCFLVVAQGTSFGRGSEQSVDIKYWYAPDKCRRPLQTATLQRLRFNSRETIAFRQQMVSFSQS